MPSIITIDRSVVKADEMATVRFSFTNNESITLLGSRGFPHITVTGGTLENVTQPLGLVDGYYVYTIRFIPTRDLEQSDCRITYRNPNSPAADGQSAAFSVDTLRPTVASASIAQSDLRFGEKTTITITFSELVLRNTFTLDDLQVGARKATFSNPPPPPPPLGWSTWRPRPPCPRRASMATRYGSTSTASPIAWATQARAAVGIGRPRRTTRHTSRLSATTSTRRPRSPSRGSPPPPSRAASPSPSPSPSASASPALVPRTSSTTPAKARWAL